MRIISLTVIGWSSVAPMRELKKRKKLEPTSIARPAFSTSSMILDDVMPLEPSAAGQSLWFITSTGRTSHQIGCVLMRLASTTWLWFGVGTNTGAVGGFGPAPSDASVTERSTDDACMVHVPGVGLFGSGHWVVIAGLTFAFHASGKAPKMEISVEPSAGPHTSPGLASAGQGMASLGFVS